MERYIVGHKICAWKIVGIFGLLGLEMGIGLGFWIWRWIHILDF